MERIEEREHFRKNDTTVRILICWQQMQTCPLPWVQEASPLQGPGAGAGDTCILGTGVAQGLSAFLLGAEALAFLPHPFPAFPSPSSQVLLRLLPAKLSQYPSALLWKEWQHHL